MKATLGKWGGSIGIRIPKEILEDLHLVDGDELEVIEKNGAILLMKPSKKRELKIKHRNNFTSKELFDEMTPEDCKLEWFESDSKKGNEIW